MEEKMDISSSGGDGDDLLVGKENKMIKDVDVNGDAEADTPCTMRKKRKKWTKYFSPEELETTQRVLDCFLLPTGRPKPVRKEDHEADGKNDGGEADEFVDLKKEINSEPKLRMLFETMRKIIFPSKETRKELKRKERNEWKSKAKQQDRKLIEETCTMRKEKLKRLITYSTIKDVVEEHSSSSSSWPPSSLLLKEVEDQVTTEEEKAEGEGEEEEDTATTETSSSSSSSSSLIPSTQREEGEPRQKKKRLLNTARSCHICHTKFREVHIHYDQLCPSCSSFNFEKRNQTCDLSTPFQRIALVTGGRVKIGLCIALALLRNGSQTIVTTRFPNDAARRFSEEPDFEQWKGRLTIYGLDFRDIPAVHRFTAHLKETLPRLDIIINNAAQTVRKPPAFYQHLLERETSPQECSLHSEIVQNRESYHYYQLSSSHSSASPSASLASSSSSTSSQFSSPLQLSTTTPPVSSSPSTFQSSSILSVPASSVLLSQTPLMLGDEVQDPKLFPPGLYDIDHQQLDLRRTNSWVQRLGEISTVEMIECHAINTFAPFILNSELRSLMERPNAEGKVLDGYIVNVSAMEGQFYRTKTPYHCHTNMAKAGLNMLTRTSAQDFALSSGIYMNSVDTGWITDENPVERHEKRMERPPPLDEWDAAMRVLDPVFTGIRDPKLRQWGLFLKNYQPTRW